MRAANGQTLMRVAQPDKSAATTATPVTPEPTDSIGLPLINCAQPAPWTKAPAKTYKQVIIIRFNGIQLDPIGLNRCLKKMAVA